MTFGWLNVIIEQELYGKGFVRDWTVGFDAFAEPAREYPLDRVAEITGVDAELIERAARTYALVDRAAIPWSPITDQQVSSTSAIRLQCALRASTGNLDIKGGEVFTGFNPGVRSDTEVEMHEQPRSPESQATRRRRVSGVYLPGYGTAWRCYGTGVGASLRQPRQRLLHGQSGGGFQGDVGQQALPREGFFALANNTLMSFANTSRIHKALMNQDLIVAYEHMLTPTAQLADYVLPGDAWLERPGMMAGISDRAMAAPGECKSIVYFWCELARRLGFGEHFPWQTEEEVLDYRLEAAPTTWDQVVAKGSLPRAANAERKYEKHGFATPTGKVELHSSVLEGFGFDPLPYVPLLPHRNLIAVGAPVIGPMAAPVDTPANDRMGVPAIERADIRRQVAQGQSAAPGVRRIRLGTVQDPIAVQRDLSGLQFQRDRCVAVAGRVANGLPEDVFLSRRRIEERHLRVQVRARDYAHGAVGRRGVVNGEPDRHHLARRQRPVRGILVPTYALAVARQLAEEVTVPADHRLA